MKSIVLQPRQVRRLQEHGSCQARFPMDPQPDEGYVWESDMPDQDEANMFVFIHERERSGRDGLIFECPYEKGEILFVQEEWRLDDPSKLELEIWEGGQNPDWIYYRGDEVHEAANYLDWRPASSMPSWASRYKVRVKRVWAEQLREIGLQDIEKEGIPCRYRTPLSLQDASDYRADFQDKWNQENPEHPRVVCESDPWVWVPELQLEGRRQ